MEIRVFKKLFVRFNLNFIKTLEVSKTTYIVIIGFRVKFVVILIYRTLEVKLKRE